MTVSTIRTAPGHTGRSLDSVERAVADLAAGRMVVVVDDADRENEGDLVLAAELATAESLGFMVRHTSGVLCAPMTGAALDRLRLPPMCAVNEDPKGTAYTVSVDAAAGVGTGISAADRARTVRVLADPVTEATDLTRPGHVFPLRAAERGVLDRPGHTEAAVDLARLAGLSPAAVIAEIVHDDGSVARMPGLAGFARDHGLSILSIADLIAHRRRQERRVVRLADARLPTRFGEFRALGYRDEVTGDEHLVLTFGQLPRDNVLVRLHPECVSGDAFGSPRCDCGAQLDAALAAIAAEGRGAVVYLRGQEGRGIGLTRKRRVGRAHSAATRDRGDAGAHVLAELGIRSVRLLNTDPGSRDSVAEYGILVNGSAGPLTGIGATRATPVGRR